jgi:hypothetical protein
VFWRCVLASSRSDSVVTTFSFLPLDLHFPGLTAAWSPSIPQVELQPNQSGERGWFRTKETGS